MEPTFDPREAMHRELCEANSAASLKEYNQAFVHALWACLYAPSKGEGMRAWAVMLFCHRKLLKEGK